MKPKTDEYWMREAIKEAETAFSEDEVPVGAVIVCNDRIIGRGHNGTERLTDVTAHAEMMAITAAQSNLGGRVLPECTLFVTVEPCYMCAGAIGWARLGRVVWGADDPKRGFNSYYGGKSPLHPKTRINSGVLAEECGELMRLFFQKKRGL
ncbi:MAG: nucleoside deaminase [Muribaculaceae bacterium]|nr:nucleoside deaminase [Muribaculaceae bacterium]